MITESKFGRRTKLWNCLCQKLQYRHQTGQKSPNLDHSELAIQIAIAGHSGRLWTNTPEELAEAILNAPETPPEGDEIFQLELNICRAEISQEWSRELCYLLAGIEPKLDVPRFTENSS